MSGTTITIDGSHNYANVIINSNSANIQHDIAGPAGPAGNAATPITTTVVVVDNISPIIQLIGDASVSVNQGGAYNEQGARIIDSGVDIGAATPSGTVDVNTPGTYIITYSGTDAAGNAATLITRIVVVVDNILPIIQLIGDVSVSVNKGDAYNEQGARIIDSGVDIGAATSSGTVDVNTLGTYTITYSGTDTAGNAATPITRTVVVALIPSYSFNFTDSSNTFSYPTLTFADSTTATATGSVTAVTWSPEDGIRTNSGGALRLPDVNFGGEFSLEAYFRFNVVASFNRICGFYNAVQNEDIGIARNGVENSMRFYVVNGGLTNRFDTEVVASLGTIDWHHIVVTRSANGDLSIYINGALMSGTSASDGATASVTTRTNNFIGRDAYGDTGDENVRFFRIYDSALTQSDVTTLYNAYAPTPPTPSFSLDFTSASISGTNLLIDGALVGTLAGSNTSTVTATPSGVSTNTTSYIALTPPSANIGGDFTLEIVCKFDPNMGGEWNAFFSAWNGGFVGDSSTHNISVERWSNTNKLYFWTKAAPDAGHHVITIDDVLGGSDFLHVVLTNKQGVSSPDTKKIYINGLNVTVTNGMAELTSIPITNTNVAKVAREHFVIGRTPWSRNDSGVEIVQYLGIYDFALTQSDVTTLYNAYTPIPAYARDLRTAVFDTGSNQAQLLDSNQSHYVIGLRKNSTNFTNVTTGPSINGGLETTTDTYVDFGTITLGPPFTIEVYGKITTNPLHGASFINLYEDGTALNTGSNTRSHIAIDRIMTVFKFMTHDATGVYSNLPQFTPSDGAADHHIVVTYSGTTKTMYVDGSLVGTVTAPALSPLTRRIIIGRNPWNDNSIEIIKYFKIWDVAVTAAQVNTMYSTKNRFFTNVGAYSP